MFLAIDIKSQRAIVIGDSQSYYIAMNSGKATLYEPLYKVGIGLRDFNFLVTQERTNYDVKFVFISIGVNDNYRYTNVPLLTNLTNKFPKASFYMVKGSYGWGNVVRVKDSFYDSVGIPTLENSVGFGNPHRNKYEYTLIGREIDKIIGW